MIPSLAILGLLLALLLVIFKDSLRISGLQDRAVLITGCGAGFGHDFVLKCLRYGMTVFAGCRTAQSAEALKKECSALPGRLIAFQMDVTISESINGARELVEAKLEELNMELFAIVNNAGTYGNLLYDDLLIVEDYLEVINVNTLGVIRVTHAFKDLIKKSKGRIINCTSAICRFVPPGLGPYTVSKFATAGYCDTIRHELAAFGVIVVNIEPGVFQTSMTETRRVTNMMDAVWRRAPSEKRSQYGEYWFKLVKETITRILNGSSKDTGWVVDTYFKALTARFPNKNYIVGYEATLFYFPYSHLSTLIQEYIMKLVAIIHGAPKPVSAK